MRRNMLSGFFCQAEDGIRDLVRSRGLGDVYKRQISRWMTTGGTGTRNCIIAALSPRGILAPFARCITCLLYTSDAADERSSVDLGGRRIIKKKTYVHKQALRPLTI